MSLSNEQPTTKALLLPVAAHNNYSCRVVENPPESAQASSSTTPGPSPADTQPRPSTGHERAQTSPPRFTSAPIDYESAYAPDSYGEELSASARVWNVYNDEARMADSDLVRGLNGTLDVLLVFAGLFSSVVTTFVAQSSQKLDPDYAQITASLVQELTRLARASASGTHALDVPASSLSIDSRTRTAADLWVNGLWLTSLTFSLLTALISVLAKQWIQHYNSISGGSPRYRAHARQYRLWGLERWKVPFIIGFLPILLNTALLLFFAGLAVYVAPMSLPIACVIIGFSVTAFLAYGVSALLPIAIPHCAYKTPVSDYIIALADTLTVYVLLPTLLRILLLYEMARMLYSQGTIRWRGLSRPWSTYRLPFLQINARESHDIEERHDLVTVHALSWLCTSSLNTSAAKISAQAAAALLTDSAALPHTLWIPCRAAESDFHRLDVELFAAPARDVLARADTIERLARAVAHFPYELARITSVWSARVWDVLYEERARIASPPLCALLRIALLERACSPDERLGTLQRGLYAADGAFFDAPGLWLHPSIWRQLDRVLWRGCGGDADAPRARSWSEYQPSCLNEPYEDTAILLREYAEGCRWENGKQRLLDDLEALKATLLRRLERAKTRNARRFAPSDSNAAGAQETKELSAEMMGRGVNCAV